MPNNLYSESDREREEPIDQEEPYRSPFRRDYARVLHSPSFRRLDGKTQLFPGSDSDYFRNRLTHSLEVSQIAESIAHRLNHQSDELGEEPGKETIDIDIVRFASLAHDLGHPPFGHNGERALNECMEDDGGFEGNAQSLRVLSTLEKKAAPTRPKEMGIDDGKDRRLGINATYRSLASVLKYDEEISTPGDGIDKGYYSTEADLVERIKEHVVGDTQPEGTFLTIECSIMDTADDIAYSAYDLKDAMQAGFVQPLDFLAPRPEHLKEIAEETEEGMKEAKRKLEQGGFREEAERYNSYIGSGYGREKIYKVLESIFKRHLVDKKDEFLNPENYSTGGSGIVSKVKDAETYQDKIEASSDIIESLISYESRKEVANMYYALSKLCSNNSYVRNKFITNIISEFIGSTDLLYCHERPPLSQVYMSPEAREQVEVIKQFTFESEVKSTRVQVVEYRGKEIVKSIFEALNSESGKGLLPRDYRTIYDRIDSDSKKRVICDFVAGMTDQYALDYYKRAYSADEQSIFEPY
jgi:dGTPase